MRKHYGNPFKVRCQDLANRKQDTFRMKTTFISNKKTPESVYAGCAGVCRDCFEWSWTVVEYMSWYDM